MTVDNSCRIVLVGKRRDGGMKYWCLQHRADATAKYGRRAKQCRHAHFKPITDSESLTLQVDAYAGGVALWGAVPPIYDTTSTVMETGVHVHARNTSGGKKVIDNTFRLVTLRDTAADGKEFTISELDAVYFMVASVFGLRTRYVVCTECGHAHLDKDWFSVHKHQTHLCAGCGRTFRDTERGIGNPIAQVQDIFCSQRRTIAPAKKSAKIAQSDFRGGISIWGSNPAIIWTTLRDEEEGVHLHAFDEKNEIVLDDTYCALSIDGLDLDAAMVRVFMAQSALPHIAGRVVSLHCPKCDFSHFDTGEYGFTPHEHHLCLSCGHEFRTRGRVRKTIGNPICDVFPKLSRKAPRPTRVHRSKLLVEAL